MTAAILRAAEQADEGDELRVPPHSIEAESAVLGALLLGCDVAWPLVRDLLTPVDFFRHAHQMVFGSISRLAHSGAAVDVIAVAEELRDHGLLDQIGGYTYLNAVAQYVPSAASISAHAGIVKEHSRRRAATTHADAVAAAAFRGDSIAMRSASEALAKTITETDTNSAKSTASFVALDRFRKDQSQQWFVKGLIPRAALGAIYGSPGSGKSFLALDLAMVLARGLPAWGALRVKKSRVGYVVAEGAAGFRMRVDGYLKEHGLSDADVPGLLIMDAAPDLLDDDAVRVVIESITKAGGLDLVFVDTLARVTPGAKESTSEDMGRALAACERINVETGAMVILIAHNGKDDTKGLRGWSGILGALDVEIKIERDKAVRSATITKLKDGTGEGDQFVFSLLPVQLGHDEDGDPITTCTVKLSDKIATTAPKGKSIDGTLNRAWQLLHSELAEGRRHSKTSFQPVAKAAGLGGEKVSDSLIDMLIDMERVDARWLRPDWKDRAPKAVYYLHPIGTTAPKSTWGISPEDALAQGIPSPQKRTGKSRDQGVRT